MKLNVVVDPSRLCETKGEDILFSTADELLTDIKSSISQGRPILVFVAVNQGNFPSIEYIASAISKDAKYKTYGIYLQSMPPKNVYHGMFHCGESLVELDSIVGQLPPVHVYLQAHGRWVFLFRRIKELNQDLRIAHEVYDWMEAFIGKPSEFINAGMFDELQIGSIIKDEAYTREHSDLLVHKDSGPWIRKKLEEVNASSVKFYPCPPLQWMETPKNSDKDSIVRLVYAGQVMNNQAPSAIFGDLDYLGLIRDLTQQGAELTIFNSVFSSREFNKDLFSEYYSEMEENPKFTFNEGIEMPGIIHALHGKYDYGLVLFDFDCDCAIGKVHLEETMASKLFTYIAAGLPVIVSEELSHMANFVRGNGIGLVVSKEERANLISTLESIDPGQFIRNISSAQKKYCIENFVDKFTDWLNQSNQA